MTVADFILSARLSAPALVDRHVRVGARIYEAVRRTRTALAMNTNLGILLLGAPLLEAAMRPGRASLRERLAIVLGELDVTDAEAVFAAIRLAAPGGLGAAARHDVRGAAAVDLLTAMGEAADRDRVARQYVTGYADVYLTGLARLAAARAAGMSEEWATAAVYLGFLAAFRDTHVARRHGAKRAEAVRARAAALDRRSRSAGVVALREALMAFDGDLKRDGVNPGTSADLTVATLLVEGLERAGRSRARIDH